MLPLGFQIQGGADSDRLHISLPAVPFSELPNFSNDRSDLETKTQNGKKDNIIYGQNLAFPAIVWSFVNVVASTASTEASEKAFRQPNTVRNFQEIFLIIDLIRKHEMMFNMMI